MKRSKRVFEKSPIPFLILLAFAIGLLMLFRQFLIINRRKEKPLKAISRVLKKQGLDLPMIKLLQAQAIHETANFTSRLFKENNNVFGMKIPQQRQTLNVAPGNQQFSQFVSVDDSIRDMLLYLDHFRIPLNQNDAFMYAQILKDKNYYEDPVEIYFKGLVNGLQIVG